MCIRDRHHRGEGEADCIAQNDQGPAPGCGEKLGEEPPKGLRRRGAEEPHVKRLGRRLPAHEQCQEHETEREDRGERGGAPQIKNMRPGGVKVELPAPAYLVQANRCERANQSETRQERKEQLPTTANKTYRDGRI